MAYMVYNWASMAYMVVVVEAHFSVQLKPKPSWTIYLIFVFGQVAKIEYILYLNRVKFSFMNTYLFIFVQEFDICATLIVVQMFLELNHLV